MSKNIKNSCINEFDSTALDENKAIKLILKSITGKIGGEIIDIKNSLGRVLYQNIKSHINIPSFKNSAMDGYAINIKNLKKNNYSLNEIAISLAGKPYNKKLKNKETVKVMTGSLIPDNADAVIMKEMTINKGKEIKFKENIKKNQNIRFVGEDIKKSSIVLKKGDTINYVNLSILSSIGIKKIKVFKKPVISFFSTGDELISINKKLTKGKIYDSNRYLLHGLLSGLPVIINDMGVAVDKESIIIKKLRECEKISNLIITTGGVSVGDADYIRDALNKIGRINFWKISIKPGRPLAYGKIGKSFFFGLPGNPVSAAVTFELFVLPAINKILGLKQKTKIIIKAKTVSEIRKKKGRVEYKRACLIQNKKGSFVKISGLQGSNILTSLSKANCYIRLASNVNAIKKDSVVDVIPFSEEI